jgi:hypothetical protein
MGTGGGCRGIPSRNSAGSGDKAGARHDAEEVASTWKENSRGEEFFTEIGGLAAIGVEITEGGKFPAIKTSISD